ncbi:MAG: MotA/TolQ/ExbB proton channel family protein [Bdellovibrionota bacterium]
MIHDIFILYRNGEIIPYIILAFLCVGYIIIFEKFFILQFVYKINFEKYNTQLKKMLLANDMDRARSFSRAVSRTGVPMLAVRAIDSYENDPMRVRAAISEEGLRFFPRLRRRMTQLPNLAAACVILGAIAAVYGIWSSFQMVDGLELGIKSFTFAKGLTLALLPLVISLVASVLLMLPFGILDAMAWRLESEMEHSLCVVLNILAPEIQPVVVSSSFSNLDSEPAVENNQNSTQQNSSAQNKEEQNTDQQVAKASNEEPEPNSPRVIPDEEEII